MALYWRELFKCFKSFKPFLATDLISLEIAPSNITQQFCIDKCRKEITEKKQAEYAYAALTSGKYCSCGNMPPKEHRFSQCQVPCHGAPDEYCGGYEDQASWFSTGNGPERKLRIFQSRKIFEGVHSTQFSITCGIDIANATDQSCRIELFESWPRFQFNTWA